MTATGTDTVVIFDGECGFCTRSMGWVQRLDRKGRVRFLPSQRSAVLDRFGLSRQDVADAVWAFDAAGGRHRGAAAVSVTLAAALGTQVPVLFYRLPVVRQAQDATYALVSRHRSRLPGVTPWCTAHPDDCPDRAA